MRVAAIDAVLAEHDQVLPIDCGDRESATIGGAIATNAFGARLASAMASIKDLIVGVEFVRPDGVTARGGGKVVKNVAGFDVPKLMVGSLGTLGGIVSATFRVFPKPEVDACRRCCKLRRTARSSQRASTIVRSNRSRSCTTRRWAASC